MTKTRREILKGGAAIGGAALFAPAVLAQSQFPSRTVRVVVPFPAGATTDMLARLIAQRLSETMGQSFVVENVGGGGGSIGADQVAKAAPDGHTLLFRNITFTTTTSSLMYAKRARHTFDDFVPVSVGAWVPLLFLAAKDVPANNLKEFVDYAKKADDAAALRLDRAGQHHESVRRGAQARRRHQDGSHPVPRRGAAGHRHAGGPHPFRRRPAVELAAARALRLAQGDGGRHQVGGAAGRADRARDGLPQSRAAGLERLPRAEGHAGRDRQPHPAGRSPRR